MRARRVQYSRVLAVLFALGFTTPCVYAAQPAPARKIIPESSGDPAWGACLAEAADIEREKHLPEKMLAAVATVESGRAAPDGRGMSPWPWTIFAEGQGQHFATRQDAIDAVRELRARGVQTIDVGCMQINLRYHPRAFTSLEEAFDPNSNVRYGAQFLETLKRTNGAWDAALEHYHSYDPARRETYRARIFAAWLKVQNTDRGFWVASDVPQRLPGEAGGDAQISAMAVSAPLLAPRATRCNWTGADPVAANWRGAPSIVHAVTLADSFATLPGPQTPGIVIAIDLSPRPGDLAAARRSLMAAQARPDVAMASAIRGSDEPGKER